MVINIEIGANTGGHTDGLIDTNSFLYTFEPSPLLYPTLIEKYKNTPNVLVLPFAVSDTDGVKQFNVSDQGDKGFGSLYDFHKDLLESPLKKHDVYHKPFAYKQNILTTRLDTFIEKYLHSQVTMIQFLWIDAQGSDLHCIRSLGQYLKLVSEGRCECTYNVPIYADTDNTYANVKSYLEDNGFNTEIIYTHEDESEVDVRFWK